MDHRIKQITDRTGLTEDQAKQAVETELTFVKGRLPAVIAAQLDGLLAGDTSSLDRSRAPDLARCLIRARKMATLLVPTG